MKVRRAHLRAEDEEFDVISAPYRLVGRRRQRGNRISAAQSRSKWVGDAGHATGPPDGEDAA